MAKKPNLALPLILLGIGGAFLIASKKRKSLPPEKLKTRKIFMNIKTQEDWNKLESTDNEFNVQLPMWTIIYPMDVEEEYVNQFAKSISDKNSVIMINIDNY